MDPLAQSDKCDIAERVVRMDKEWTLLTRHVDLPIAAAGAQTLLEYNPYRVKFTIYNRTPNLLCELSQMPPSSLGAFIGFNFSTQDLAGSNYLEFSRNFEDDKAECTGKWMARGDTVGTTCLYVSEVFYSGNKHGCNQSSTSLDDCVQECKRQETIRGTEQTSDSNSGLNSSGAKQATDRPSGTSSGGDETSECESAWDGCCD